MDSVYLMILNIPRNFHSSDLRSYFSDFIESQAHFTCFHFRHRPQLELINPSEAFSFEENNFYLNSTSGIKSAPASNLLIKDSVCCIVKLFSKEARTEAIRKYNLQNWVDKHERFLPSRCIAIAITVVEEYVRNSLDSSICINDGKVELKLSKQKIEQMVELKPPPLMPRGNVGTSTKHFLNLINSCRLPSNLIGKLGLNFPKTKTRRYGNVPFNYENHTCEKIELPVSSLTNSTNSNNKIKIFPHEPNSYSAKKCTNKGDTMDDDDVEQEWDRHEALHDDVTEQERNKERLYEEEMEVVWEKGGPGIVWYTDAQRWQEAEGDFDEQTADDWDVDYSVYFEENGGDKDARDCAEMRRSTMWRQGNVETVFKKPQILPLRRKSFMEHSTGRNVVGPFEKHTKGIGRRLMEKQGWRDGLGLGVAQKGIAQPIESDGQKPRERKGLGYFGERLPRFRVANSSKAKCVFIATAYDSPADTDPPESLNRRNQPTTMKYRHK
ncbi:G patch domain-containing protein 3-like [Daphnia carinata]|uniref:G patch domain-containing protein 3-like n=1 Tax=Daphnia carinata TaxID=120202 RepID=UPI00257B33E4|nr:G patch domain-containing protein 3-like [Daphnia carinata]